MQLDTENKNRSSKWYDAIKLEMDSMQEYKVFKKWDKAILDKHKKIMNPPKGYHKIKVHLVFLLSSLMVDIKLDWWQMPPCT